MHGPAPVRPRFRKGDAAPEIRAWQRSQAVDMARLSACPSAKASTGLPPGSLHIPLRPTSGRAVQQQVRLRRLAALLDCRKRSRPRL
jgi:hypothetical protein